MSLSWQGGMMAEGSWAITCLTTAQRAYRKPSGALNSQSPPTVTSSLQLGCTYPNQLGTKYSNVWAYGGHSHPNHHRRNPGQPEKTVEKARLCRRKALVQIWNWLCPQLLFALLTVTFPPALTRSCNMKQEVGSHRAKDRCRCLVVNRVLHWSFYLLRYNTYKPTSVVTTNPSLTYGLTASQTSTTKPSHSLWYLYWLNCNCELALLKHKRWGSKPKWKEMLSHSENLFMMQPWKLPNRMAHWNLTKCINCVPLTSSKSL